MLRSASGDEVGSGNILALGSKTVQKSTGKMLGKGNVLVKVTNVAGKFAKFTIPFPAGTRPECLCDVETVIWPISQLSSKYSLFSLHHHNAYILCHRRHRRDEEKSQGPLGAAP